MRFAVTGCARSGTTYLAEVLRVAGYNVGLEHTFTPKFQPEVIGGYDGESSHAAGYWLDKIGTLDWPIVHVVRNPYRNVNSLLNVIGDLRKWEFWDKVENDGKDDIGRAIRYVFEYNALCENLFDGYPYLRVRIEDLVDAPAFRRLLKHIGGRTYTPAMLSVSRKTNSTEERGHKRKNRIKEVKSHPDSTLLRKMAKNYGYV